MEEEKKIEKAEKEIAKEISKTEEKVAEHEITQKQADKEIKQEVKEEVEEIKEKQTKPIANKKVSEQKKEEQSEQKKEEQSEKKENPMREIEIEKIVFNCGAIGDKLEKSVKLLEMVTKRKIYRVKSTKRIPAFGIAPGKESGCKVTVRNKEQIKDLLKRFFATLDGEISGKKITENHVSFGIHEYIEVPGLEYDRDIGILGFEVSVVFKRKGKRTQMKKAKRGKLPQKQQITKKEIIEFLTKNFGVEVI